MAEAQLNETKLIMTFNAGEDEKGEAILNKKTYQNINPDSTADQLVQAAQALGTLTIFPISKVERNDNFELLA
ncbi:DUF1659 domain-containing protein [Bacillaceae bacterium Marseille-Q3522]|nr:DUF1659 domain-containing protein [Bacillaceae bacterium Marseille-Q3522]